MSGARLMKSDKTSSSFQLLWKILLSASLCLVAMGCEKDSKDHYLEGTSALSQKKYDQAIASYNKALELDAANFDATVGLAEAYVKKGDTAKAKQYFEKAQSFKVTGAKEKYLSQLMQEMLLVEAKAIEDKTTDSYRDSLWKIIKIRDRGHEANEAYSMLGEFYMERGDALAKEKATREKAVEMYLSFKKIRTQRALRTQALEKAKKLRREIYKDKFAANFDKAKAVLLKEGLYDEAKKLVKIKVLVEEKEINPKTDEEKGKLKQKLANQALFNLVKMTFSLSGEPMPPDNELKRLKFTTFAEVDGGTIMEKGKAQFIASVGLDDIEEVSYKRIVIPNRKAAEAAARKSSKGPAAEAKTPGTATSKADAGAPATSKADAGAPAASKADAGAPAKASP